MPISIASPTLLGLGIFLFLIGLWMWRWSSRNAIDVKGAALGAAWQGLKQGRLDIPEDIKSRMNELAAEKSNVDRARKAGGMAVRHVMAKVMGIGGALGIIGGLALAAAGVFWR